MALKRLAILSRTVKDMTPIYALSSTLESLSVQSAPTAAIDLGSLPSLKSLSTEWARSGRRLASYQPLNDLFLLSHSEVDLHPLRSNPRLVRLRFKFRPHLRSLAGLEALQAVEHLGIYSCSAADITALEDLPPAQVRELHLPIRAQQPSRSGTQLPGNRQNGWPAGSNMTSTRSGWG